LLHDLFEFGFADDPLRRLLPELLVHRAQFLLVDCPERYMRQRLI
jgi:hypothetical protein